MVEIRTGRGAGVGRNKGERGWKSRNLPPASLGELSLPAVAQAFQEFVRADDFSVERARDQRFTVDFAGLALSDGDVIDLESAAQRALVASSPRGRPVILF